MRRRAHTSTKVVRRESETFVREVLYQMESTVLVVLHPAKEADAESAPLRIACTIIVITTRFSKMSEH